MAVGRSMVGGFGDAGRAEVQFHVVEVMAGWGDK
jgi:hypothetical protein